MGRHEGETRARHARILEAHGERPAKPDGRRNLWHDHGPRLCSQLWLLVHQLPCGSARHGRPRHDRRAQHAHRGFLPEDVHPLHRHRARHRRRGSRPNGRRLHAAYQGRRPRLRQGPDLPDGPVLPHRHVRRRDHGPRRFVYVRHGRNVTAFNTVWTYDIYQSYIRKAPRTPTTSGWAAWPLFSAPLSPLGPPTSRDPSTT